MPYLMRAAGDRRRFLALGNSQSPFRTPTYLYLANTQLPAASGRFL